MNENNGRRRGTLAHWNDTRGFGFITDNENSEKLYLHASDVEDDGNGRKIDNHFVSLRRGMLVSYERADRPRGPVAQRVRVEKGA